MQSSEVIQTLGRVLTVLGLVLSLSSPIQASPGSSRVLFVGNSLSSYNGGVDRHLQSLAASARPARTVQVESAYLNGVTLYLHLREPGLLWRLQSTKRDWVILQDDLPEYRFDLRGKLFRQAVREAVAAVRRSGSEPVLFLAWSYGGLERGSLAEFVALHREISAELGLTVAPVGPAFQRVEKERPDIHLRLPDNEHPSSAGTYLAACVLLGTLWGSENGGGVWHPDDLRDDTAAYLRRIARESVRAWMLAP